ACHARTVAEELFEVGFHGRATDLSPDFEALGFAQPARLVRVECGSSFCDLPEVFVNGVPVDGAVRIERHGSSSCRKLICLNQWLSRSSRTSRSSSASSPS